MTVRFESGRCYFNEFNPVNDLDETTKKSGVECYSLNLIGAILSLIGLSNKIEFMVGKQIKWVYVQNKDFKKWTDRHISNDSGLDVKLVKQALLEKNFDDVIEEISKNHRTNQKLKFENDAQSKYLMEIADVEFEKHSSKKQIMEKIQRFLVGSFDKIDNETLTKTIFFKRVVPQIGWTWDDENAALDFLKKNKVKCYCIQTIHLH